MAGSKNQTIDRSDTNRAEAFSDGVLAIIITLLVLDLRPPRVEPGQLFSGLLQQWPVYLAYVTSYLYVGVVWLNHKTAFKRIRFIDWGLHWANQGILFTTALLPFATAVVADAMQEGDLADERTAVGVYALIGALLCLSWLWFFHYLSKHPDLIEENVSKDFFPRERIRAAAGFGLYLLGGILGYFIATWIGLAAFLVLPIFYAVTSQGLYELPAALRRG